MFSLFKRNRPQEHPILGSIIYRANKGNNKADIPGFWEGRLETTTYGTVKLLIWGDKSGPTAEQIALYQQIKNNLPTYLQQSKDGLCNYIQGAEGKAATEWSWDLEQLYIQAYPMRTRLKEDLPEALHGGVAWGFCFSVGGLGEGEDAYTAYSAYVNAQLHPKFPFTYH